MSAVGVRQVTEADVLQVLKGVEDPEMPISIVDLGIVEGVAVGEKGAVTVTLMPTFTGCPALEVIEKKVKDALKERLNVADVEVKWTFGGEWSTEKITEEGRVALKSFGIAVAPKPGKVECPYCRSHNVVRESAFGCSLCREIYYCNDCKNPFESMRRLVRVEA